MIDAKTLRKIMQRLGARGGKARSEAKTAAARANARKPRRRLCRGCDCQLTSADKEAGKCTQCGELIVVIRRKGKS